MTGSRPAASSQQCNPLQTRAQRQLRSLKPDGTIHHAAAGLRPLIRNLRPSRIRPKAHAQRRLHSQLLSPVQLLNLVQPKRLNLHLRLTPHRPTIRHPRTTTNTKHGKEPIKPARPTVSRGPRRICGRPISASPETERAARQQGSSLLRENSSNGGKTIRTFWLHSRSGGRECQG